MRTTRMGVSLLLLTLALPAQETGAVSKQPVRNPEPPVVLTMAFPGGTMAHFVAALRRVEPNANIVMATRAAEALVPPMELRGAGLEQALESACMVVEGPIDVAVKDSGGGGQPIYTILARDRRREQALVDRDEVVQRVFTLNQLTMRRPGTSGLEPLATETILSAIELVTTADDKGPLLRYHKDSGLLLVRGTPRQVDAAAEALSVMASDLDQREQMLRAAGFPAAEPQTPPTEGTR